MFYYLKKGVWRYVVYRFANAYDECDCIEL